MTNLCESCNKKSVCKYIDKYKEIIDKFSEKDLKDLPFVIKLDCYHFSMDTLPYPSPYPIDPVIYPSNPFPNIPTCKMETVTSEQLGKGFKIK